MKFALLFLSALLVVSHQQFQQYRGGLDWWPPFYQQSYLGNYQQPVPFIGSYQQPQHYQEQEPSIHSYPPFYYNNVQNDNPPYHRRNRPNVTPASYFQNDEVDLNAMETQDDGTENGFPDTQSRIKGFGRYRPSLVNQNQGLSPRFFYSLISGNSIANPLLKTVTFTSTSTVTIATVQSCLSSSLFVTGSQNVNCRKRKRQISEFWDDDDNNGDNDNNDIQFSIVPSETQPVVPTELPSPDQQNQEHTNKTIKNELVSSQNEEGLRSETPVSSYLGDNARAKRFLYFFKYVYSSTVTSYSFISTTITKAVNLVSATAGASALLCMPQGYVVCT